MKRRIPDTIWPTSWVDWLVIVIILLPLLAGLFIGTMVDLPPLDTR